MKDTSMGIIPIYRDTAGLLYLLIQHNNGHWGFPKGHPNPGESEIETARRELREETGISECELMDGFRCVETYIVRKENMPSHEKDVIFFLGEVKNMNVTVQPEEIQNHKWLTFEDAMELITYQQAKDILRKAQEFISLATPPQT